jgi:hypothetical protein
MAFFVGPEVVVGAPGDIHTSALNSVGTTARGSDRNVYIYLKGVASTVAGSWVTYDEAGVTALLAANAKGPVAVASAATVANTYGWYCIFGTPNALIAANCADNVCIGRETSDGTAGDGRAAGDEIIGAITRGSTSGSPALTPVQISSPLVNDITGS